MASAETLWRLHSAKKPDGAAEGTEVSAIADTLPAAPELPIRGRFVIRREQPEATYQLDSAEILSSVSEASVPVDHSEAFAELAWRERLAQAARHRLRGGQRGSAGSAGGAISIQA
jgi:hypothetical protein